tara:strand:+ start:1648 stop:2493 length:846 start_codon:yes stop_codon:yes gene_type:complete
MAYLRPDKLDDALDWLAVKQPLVIAGCTDIYPTRHTPSLEGPLLDITAIDELRGIEMRDGWRRFGAATSWSEILRTPLPTSYAMLKQASSEIGAVQIQNSGTIGGNLCTASPAADSVPCLMALDAEIELSSVRGRRRLDLAAFFTGARQTALQPDELVIAIHIPEKAETGISGFHKLGARHYLVISIAMVAVRLVVEAGRIISARIVIGACAPVATRLKELEAALVGVSLDEIPERAQQIDDDIHRSLAPIDDVRASTDYRYRAAAEITQRMIADLCVKAS